MEQPMIDIKRVKRWFWRFFASGLPIDSDLDVLRKHFLLNLMGILGTFFLGIFALIAFAQKDYILGLVDSAVLLFLVFFIYILRIRKNHDFVDLFSTIIIGFFYLFLVSYGDLEKVTYLYLWALTYPLIALYLLGKKLGTYISLSLLCMACFFFLISRSIEGLPQYDIGLIIRFVAVYLIIHSFSFVAEIVREIIHNKLQASKSELLDSFHEIQVSSSKLSKINQQLSREIEDRKRIEKALQYSENFLNDIIESIQDGISVLNLDLSIRHTNSVMREWYNQNLPLIGKRCYECYHNKSEPCDPCPTLRCMQTGQTEREIVPGLSGSSVEWVELFCFPLKDKESGQITGAIEFVRDISIPKRLEQQLSHSQKMEAVGTLAGGIAHDFNNLLMGIQGRASLLKVSLPPSDPNLEHIVAVEEHVKSASELTRQLLGTARGGKYDSKPTNLNDLVENNAIMFGRTRKEILIQTHLYQSPVVAEVDRSQIEQVLLNMYVNAWQAMPDGGELIISTSIETLENSFCQPYQISPGQYAKISITDTGIGMDASVRRQIFDPFFTTKDKGRGTGLGLASAYGIIKNHNGVITIDSEVDYGTTFNIFLPLSGKKPFQEVPPQTEFVKNTGTILLVDDEEMILEVSQALLKELGYKIIIARSGGQAINIIEQMGREIDLVILDLIMPEMDGGSTFDQIRELVPLMPVILASGYALSGQASEILQRGCNGFIQKPFNLSELSQKIRTILDSVEDSQG